MGRLTTTVDNDGNVTTIACDSLGRRLSILDPDTGLTTCSYGYRDLEQTTDGAGNVINWTFDELNRLLMKQYMNPPEAEHPHDVIFAYDGAGAGGSVGRLTLASMADGIDVRLEDEFVHDE